MAPADDDETQSSDWTHESHDSPAAKRHCSEPTQSHQKINPNSIETSLSPPPSIHHQVKCPWCAKDFDTPEDGVVSEYDALKEHLALMHPKIASLSPYDIPSKKETHPESVLASIDEVNSNESDSSVSNAAAITTDVDATPLANVDAPTLEASDALHNKLHDVQRQRVRAYTEKLMVECWNLHNVHNFSKDYDHTVTDLEQTWCHVFESKKTTDKKITANIATRPEPYLKTSIARGEFLELTPVDDYLNMLKDFESMPTDELYTVSANVAHALKTWQDEWLAIEDLSKRVSQGKPTKKSANPRALDLPEVFQDKREAMLYGYKYDPSIHDPKKHDPKKDFMFKCQDPFIQGGFRPTAAQLRKMQGEVGNGNPNPDGFKTITKNGQEYAPRFQNPPIAPFEGRGATSRKRKVAQSEVAALRQMSGHDSTTPAVDSDIDGRPFKRLTRSIASKANETPQTKTAPPSPGGVRGRGVRGGRGGRGGRGRGGVSKTSRPLQITSAVSTTVDALTDDTASNELGGASSLSRAVTTSPAADSLPFDQASVGSSGTANIAPAPKPPLAPATPGAPPAMAALPPNLIQPGEVVDSTELNRRKLLAKSKNPRRTQAMLDHWKRFNKEGRTRNPKRTKAQIEADRRAEAERRANEPPKPATPAVKARKRKIANNDDDPANTQVAKQPKTNASLASTVSLQPAPIQPAATPLPPSIPAPTAPLVPNPAAITPQPRLIPPSLPPSRPLSPQGFPAPHPQSVLPGFDRNAGPPGPPGPPLWSAPSQYYPYPNPPPPLYSSYGRSQYPPPPPPHPQVHHQPPHYDPGPAEVRQPGQQYPPYDVRRPLPHLQNGPPIPRP